MIYALIVIIIFVFIFAMSGIKIIRPYQKGVIERLGKFNRIGEPGLQFIVPLFERMTKVDMREQVIDVPPQEVITNDNVVVSVDAVIYYQVTDAYMVLYNISMFQEAAVKLAQTNLRNVIGELELDQTLTSREMINTKLREVLDDATDNWGVKVSRVEIKRIDPPQDITDAMSRQMKSERIKRAVILEAQGIKESQITKAEGAKQSKILEAQGKAEAIKLEAEATKYRLSTEAQGQAEAIYKVFDSIHKGNPTNDVIAIKYLEALKDIANGTASKVFLPLETSGILGSIGAVKELFVEDKKDNEVK
ncbi:MAG TPA: SPFH domain-containing protein [Thermotogota bacterium]|nr:SPFH domain-containing protein [Thermotogota bacterium]HPJ89175.1 SPFH domain-containing protein [Thermotogota bacterium]HPR95662.1 SPFH domain-containing protein [Thermotogota bacterium]